MEWTLWDTLDKKYYEKDFRFWMVSHSIRKYFEVEAVALSISTYIYTIVKAIKLV